MEFGFEPVCDQVRAGSSNCAGEISLQVLHSRIKGNNIFHFSRHVEIARTWSQTGSKLVADLLARASSLLAS